MRWRNPVLDEYRRLQEESNDQRRGREFQTLISRIFEQDHFDVLENAGAAKPRQTDLFATKGRDNYLIETKWRARRVADVGDVDSLLSRLERTESSVVGVFFSISGFSSTAIEQVRVRRDRPILLFGVEETESLVSGNLGLSAILRQKHQDLRAHGRVFLGSGERLSRPSLRKANELPPSDPVIVFPDGRRTSWIGCAGDFSQFVFADELPDIDWVPATGTGVVVDLDLSETHQTGLAEVLKQLAAVGWATGSGRWSIQQSSRNWHGIGVRSLADAVAGWESRYEEVESVHHTEQLCYQDAADGGFYTLTADISASEERRVWHCDLSLQLSGIPIDTDPLRQLASGLKAAEPWHFRPLNEKSIRTGHPTREERLPLTPVALVVEENIDEKDPRDRDWVSGVIVRNPYFGDRARREDRDDEWLPLVSESEYLVCSLRSHHPLADPRDSYFLRRFEWTWTSDALVFRATVDWD